MRTFDLAIIGSGSGGARAAELAARRGGRVILLEEGLLGGNSLHAGSVPLSLLSRSARHWREMNTDPLQQVLRPPSLLADWMSIARRETARKSAQMFEDLRALGVATEGGRARLAGHQLLRIERRNVEVETIRADAIIVATGARPRLPQTPGHVDLRGLLQSCVEPKELTIIGGGHIGCEFAGIFNALGTDVTIFERGPTLLPELDAEAGAHLLSMFRSRGIAVRCDTVATDTPDGVPSPRSGASREPMSPVLWATGRIPNVDDLGLEAAGVELRDGAIRVDSHLRTTANGVYAIGDVTGLDGLASGARAQAQIAVHNIFGGQSIYDPRLIPRCYWSQPAVASVGLSEREALASGRLVRIGRSRSPGGLASGGESPALSLVKLVADGETGTLLGGLLIGEHAGDLINVVSMALQFRAKPDDLCSNLVAPALADAFADCQRQMR